MPPRSFVSSVYWASPGESRSRSFESTPCRNACASSPADLQLSHVRDVEQAGCRAHGAHLVDHARRTAPASPNRRRGRGARPTPRGVRTAACAAARPAPRRTIPARPARGDEADLVCERVGGARLVLAHGADRAEERELVAQVGAHHLRAVRRDGHAHARVEERAEDRSAPRRRRRARRSAGSRSGRPRARCPSRPAARSARGRPQRGCRARCGRAAAPRSPRRPPRGSPPRRSAPSRPGRPRAPAARAARAAHRRSARRPGRGPAMSMPTTPRAA